MSKEFNHGMLKEDGTVEAAGVKPYIENISSAKVVYHELSSTNIIIMGSSDGESNMVSIPVGTFTNYFDFENDGTAGEIIYSGGKTKPIHISATISGYPNNDDLEMVFGIAINGTVVSYGYIKTRQANVNVSCTVLALEELETGDEITVKVGNMTEISNYNVTHLSLIVHG